MEQALQYLPTGKASQHFYAIRTRVAVAQNEHYLNKYSMYTFIRSLSGSHMEQALQYLPTGKASQHFYAMRTRVAVAQNEHYLNR
jgi:hypothetical protein